MQLWKFYVALMLSNIMDERIELRNLYGPNKITKEKNQTENDKNIYISVKWAASVWEVCQVTELSEKNVRTRKQL